MREEPHIQTLGSALLFNGRCCTFLLQTLASSSSISSSLREFPSGSSSNSDSNFRLLGDITFSFFFSLSLSAGETVEERKCPELKRSIHSYCYVLEVRQISASTRVWYFTCELSFNWIRHPGFFLFSFTSPSLIPDDDDISATCVKPWFVSEF